MTIQSINPFVFPDWHSGYPTLTAPTVTMQTCSTLDGANDAFMWCGDAPATGNLTDFYFRIGTTSVTSGPLNFDGRVETVSNGRPTGTLFNTNTNGAISIGDTDDNTWKTCTLTAAASVTRGTSLIGLVVKAPGSGTFSVIINGLSNNNGQFPPPGNWPVAGSDANGDGTYEAMQTSVSPALLVKISGTIYHLGGCSPWDSVSSVIYNNGSATDERAMRIYSPVPMRIIAIEAFISNAAAGADFTLTLWPDSAGTQTDADALAQAAHDGDAVLMTTQDGWVRRYFPTAVTIAANTVYWAACRADTANNIGLFVGVFPSITGVGSAGHGGAEFYLGGRSWSAGSASTFSPDATSQPFIRLIVDGLDDGAGAGGGGGPLVGGRLVL